jgi:hypothetical protein
MSDQPVPTPADVAPAAAPSTPEPVATAPAAEPTEPAKANVWDSPESAKAEIERLRRENGAARTNAKQTAADEARAELAQTIGKALGLVKDDETADPAKLIEQAQADKAAAQSARVELAVFKAASAVGGDPAALLDSASFLAKVASLDPSDTSAVTAAIQEAVAANPRLGAAPASRVPAPNPAQGSSGSGASGVTQLSREDMARMAPEDIVKAQAEGRFDRLMSGK